MIDFATETRWSADTLRQHAASIDAINRLSPPAMEQVRAMLHAAIAVGKSATAFFADVRKLGMIQ